MAAESTFVKNNVLGTVVLKDGTGTPVTLTMTLDRGDIKVTRLSQKLNELVKIVRRGRRASFAHGERIFPALTFSGFIGNLVGSSSSAPGTPYEFVTNKGAYSANISTLGANRLYTVNVEITYEGTNYGDSADEKLTLNDCYFFQDFTEDMGGNYWSFSADVLGTVIHTNSTNTVTMQEIQ